MNASRQKRRALLGTLVLGDCTRTVSTTVVGAIVKYMTLDSRNVRHVADRLAVAIRLVTQCNSEYER
jgi:hypothetical protein